MTAPPALHVVIPGICLPPQRPRAILWRLLTIADETKAGFDDLSVSFEFGAGNAKSLGNAVDGMTPKIDRAVGSASRFSPATRAGTRARFGLNQSAVDAALATGNKPFLIGTRIKALDGGSVLIDGGWR